MWSRWPPAKRAAADLGAVRRRAHHGRRGTSRCASSVDWADGLARMAELALQSADGGMASGPATSETARSTTVPTN